jgi:acyl-CoA dehydrogenase
MIMSWCFETDADYQEQLDWVEKFVRGEVEPIDHLIEHPCKMDDPLRNKLIKPLQQQVRDRGLWACHLKSELGGQGYGQLKLALLNEILGRSLSAPVVFGCQAPDSGNAEILAHYGTPELKDRYLQPLLANDIVSCYSMTEPHGGSDPTAFVTRAELHGDEWVVNGEKWFSSHARFASFYITMAVTDPDAPPHGRASMFVVPADTPGVTIVRNINVWGHENHEGTHGYVRYENVRIPRDHMLGERGTGFAVAQTRLGGGRIHHAMRTVGLVKASLDLMLERAVSRRSGAGRLADRQLVQEHIAYSWILVQQFRLLVLQTAWKIDRYQDYKKVSGDISAVKVAMPKVLMDVVSRAIQVHGALGISTEMPLGKWAMESFHMGFADGPTEIHKVHLAKRLLGSTEPAPGLFPTGHLIAQKERARQHFADLLDEEVLSS